MKKKAMTVLTIWMLLISIVGMLFMLGLIFYAFSLFGQFSSLSLTYDQAFEHGLWLEATKQCFAYYDPVLFRTYPSLLDLSLLNKTRFAQCLGNFPLHVIFETPSGTKDFALASWQRDDLLYSVPVLYYNKTTHERFLGTLHFGVTVLDS